MGVWLMVWAGTAFAQCEDPAVVVTEAEAAVIEVRLDEAESALDRVEAALGCSPIASSELLGRMWLAEGVMLSIAGDAAAEDSFAAAHRVAPGFWNEDYGPKLHERYQAAQLSHIPGQGEIHLEAPIKGHIIGIDGRMASLPMSLASGLHVVQVGRSAQEILFAKMVFVPDGVDVQITTGLVEEGIEPVPETEEEEVVATTVVEPVPKKKGVPVFLIAGAGAAVVGGSMAIAAVTQNTAMKNAETLDELNAAHERQVGFGATAYTLLGLSAVGVVFHFVL